LNSALQEGLAGLVRIYDVVDEQPKIVDRSDAITLPAGGGRLVFEHVRFDYPDGRTGLFDLSFVAEPGLTVALVGPSGAGKSTALALIPRLQDVTAGAVLVDGADVRAVTQASLRDAIAYVGQDALLFDDTIAANIRMGRPGATEAEVIAAAEAASGDFIAALPEGFETRVGPNGQRLSCAIRGYCCWMRRRARWIRRASRRCSGRSPSCAAAAPRLWWRTGYRPCGTPILSSCCRKAAMWSRARMQACWRWMGCTLRWCAIRGSFSRKAGALPLDPAGALPPPSFRLPPSPYPHTTAADRRTAAAAG
jgi:hypothetical protein